MFANFFNLRRRKLELEFELEKMQEKLDHEKRKWGSEFEALKSKHDLERLEKETLLKLKNEQDMAQVKLDAERATIKLEAGYDKQLRALETKHSGDLSKLKSDTAKEYYEKMQDALKDMTLNGSEQTKFTQELALKMFDKALEKPVPIAPQHQITEKRRTKIVEVPAKG